MATFVILLHILIKLNDRYANCFFVQQEVLFHVLYIFNEPYPTGENLAYMPLTCFV